MLVVPGVDKKFDKAGTLIDQSFHHNVHNFVSEFLWLAERIAKKLQHQDEQLKAG
jgi:hypothetical protein